MWQFRFQSPNRKKCLNIEICKFKLYEMKREGETYFRAQHLPLIYVLLRNIKNNQVYVHVLLKL